MSRRTRSRAAPVAALLALVALVGAVSGAIALEHGRSGGSTERLYPGRPGTQPGDVEVPLGETAQLAGLEVTLVDGELRSSVSPLEPGGYLEVEVVVANPGPASAVHDRAAWSVRTPFGVEVPAAITTVPDIETGPIPSGERQEGPVRFEVGEAAGHYYVAHEAEAGLRAVWQVIVPRGEVDRAG